MSRGPTAADCWGRDVALLKRLFPFCFTVGPNGELLALGDRWRTYLPRLTVGMPFAAGFRVLRPFGVSDQNGFAQHHDDVFVLTLVDRPEIPFRGQFFASLDEQSRPVWHFVGGPWLTSLGDLHRHELTFRDFPPHDPRGDMLVLLQTQESSLGDLRKLNSQLQERMDRQAALEAQIRQIQKMELVGRLAGGLAHNFNNILMTISSHAELGLMQVHDSHPLRESFEQIIAATEQATTLTRGLASMSRKHPVALVELNLVREVEELKKLTEPLLAKQVTLEIQCEPCLPRFRGDRSSLQQILMNLVINARDAMPRGGTITLSVSRIVPVKHFPGDCDQLELKVSDNGVGMDEKTRSKLFEPFFTTKGPERGVGLGLSTVMGLVTQFGGTIDVDSKLGEGTTFRILLPYTIAAPTAAPPAPVVAKPTTDACIMLVDDDALVRRPLEMLLKRAGYRVNSYGSAEAALAKVASGEQYEILVTDVVMPGKNGVQLVAELEERGMPRPTVFISGHHEESDLRAGALPPHHRFLAKPFATDELLRVIRELRPH